MGHGDGPGSTGPLAGDAGGAATIGAGALGSGRRRLTPARSLGQVAQRRAGLIASSRWNLTNSTRSRLHASPATTGAGSMLWTDRPKSVGRVEAERRRSRLSGPEGDG